MLHRFPSFLIVFLSLLYAGHGAALRGDDRLAQRVIVVVNEADPESVQLGEYYTNRRGIPQDNIASLRAPLQETVSWAEFIEHIHNPLQDWLIRNRWIDGLTTPLTDEQGRHRNIIHGHRISHLVVCRGIPLRVAHDASRLSPSHEESIAKPFLTTAGAVDSELSLLTIPGYPLVSHLHNPLFQNASPTPNSLARVIKVARLDGPSVSHAKQLIDDAMAVEQTGLLGRAYVDVSGPHETGNAWLMETAGHLKKLGYPPTIHENSGVFPIETRFDAPVLYFGWYASDITGPFLTEGFRFPRGAIALHIHSFSASTLRSEVKTWCGPMVARGAAVTMGNVYEPYLQFSHRPHLFLERLAQGYNVGDAAYYALPALSWQSILIGDPLYRPFSISLEEQIARLDQRENDPLGGYAYLRKMEELAAEGRRKEALGTGLRGMNRHPNPALALGLAELQIYVRDNESAIRTLKTIARLPEIAPGKSLLAKEVADLLGNRLHQFRPALNIYETILRQKSLPGPVRMTVLEDGAIMAARSGQISMANTWRAELNGLRNDRSSR